MVQSWLTLLFLTCVTWPVDSCGSPIAYIDIYAFPRVSILPGHEQKAFIPFTTMFTRGQDDAQRAHAGRHQLIHGTVTGLSERTVRYTPFVPRAGSARNGDASDDPTGLEEGPEETLHFDYCIYSLGAKYPSPINVWTHQEGIFKREPSPIREAISSRETHAHEINTTAIASTSSTSASGVGAKGVRETTECTGTKPEGISWMRAAQRRIEETEKILIVGGGALGVRESSPCGRVRVARTTLNRCWGRSILMGAVSEMATDIIATHGPSSKKITLLHSRSHLLNRFEPGMHDQTMKRMKEFGIEVILGSRVDASFINKTEGGKVRTTDGREVEADLIVSP